METVTIAGKTYQKTKSFNTFEGEDKIEKLHEALATGIPVYFRFLGWCGPSIETQAFAVALLDAATGTETKKKYWTTTAIETQLKSLGIIEGDTIEVIYRGPVKLKTGNLFHAYEIAKLT